DTSGALSQKRGKITYNIRCVDWSQALLIRIYWRRINGTATQKVSRVTASIVTILGTLGLACQAQKPALTVDKANELVRESAEVHRFDQSILAKLGSANCQRRLNIPQFPPVEISPLSPVEIS